MTVAIVRGGTTVEITLADETVTITGYGTCRQITLFEAGAAVLQILTSDTTACPGALIAFMRARWRIENLFKYLDFYGIDYLADYTATIDVNTKPIDSPARKAARAHLTTLRAELAQLKQRLGQTLTDPHTPTTVAAANQALTRTQNDIRKLHIQIERAEHELKTIPVLRDIDLGQANSPETSMHSTRTGSGPTLSNGPPPGAFERPFPAAGQRRREGPLAFKITRSLFRPSSP